MAPPPAAGGLGADDKLEFHPLGTPTNGELGDWMQAVRIRVLRYLELQGIIESKADLTSVDDDFAEREPSLAALARASVSGLANLRSAIFRRPRATLVLDRVKCW